MSKSENPGLPAAENRFFSFEKKSTNSFEWYSHDRATGRHLPYGITLLPATRHK